MDDIIALSPRELAELSAFQTSGLYLLQSVTTPTLFRLGETRNLSARSGTHGRKAPKSAWKKAPNWTEVHRPWQFVWALSLPMATELSLKMCEHHLYAAYAQLYDFVDVSGFEAPAEAVPRLREIADLQRAAFSAINARQRRERFDKKAHFHNAPIAQTPDPSA